MYQKIKKDNTVVTADPSCCGMTLNKSIKKIDKIKSIQEENFTKIYKLIF